MILVSMCLAGIDCNYKGESKPNKRVIELIKKGKAIPICPEQLGGLPTPRSGARITTSKGIDVIKGKAFLKTDNRGDVTKEYIHGANLTLKLVNDFKISTVILKQGSPSCGTRITQGGLKERSTVPGEGVTTALLIKKGIKVLSEEDLENDELFFELMK